MKSTASNKLTRARKNDIANQKSTYYYHLELVAHAILNLFVAVEIPQIRSFKFTLYSTLHVMTAASANVTHMTDQMPDKRRAQAGRESEHQIYLHNAKLILCSVTSYLLSQVVGIELADGTLSVHITANTYIRWSYTEILLSHTFRCPQRDHPWPPKFRIHPS